MNNNNIFVKNIQYSFVKEITNADKKIKFCH